MKIRKIFFLTNKQKKLWIKVNKWSSDKKIKPDQIFFSDEIKIYLNPFLNGSIRLSEKNQDKLGNTDVYQLIHKPKK